MSQGRVEIKFLTDTKEIEAAKKAITDLEKNIDSALKASASDDVSKAFNSMGSEAETASEKVDDVTTSVEKLGSETSDLSSTNNGLEEMAKEADTTAGKVDEVTVSVDKLDSEVSQLSDSDSGLDSMGDEADSTAVKVDGVTESVDRLGSETDQLGDDPNLGGLPDSIEEVGEKADKSTGGVKKLVSALGILKVAGAALNMITNSVSDAISRVDTMRQFPKMMQQVGFTAQEAERSISKLAEGIQGLPTRLDDVVSTTQQIALINGDLNEATELTLALNNAFLASGSSSADASRGLQQFTQMLSSGTVDMQSWRTLLETMPLALQTVAESFGYAGASAKNDLYAALQDGIITFDEFSQALITANEEVGGFAELALTGSEGMATSFENVRTAVVNGVSKVIEALDNLVEDLTGKNIAQHFDQLKVSIGGAFSTIASSIGSATPHIRSAITLFRKLSPLIVGVTSAYGAFRIITSVAGWFKTMNATIAVLNTTKATYLGVTKALTLAEVNATTVQKALAIVMGLYTGSVTSATVATTLFSTAISVMTGPIGWAAAAIGILVGGFLLLKRTVGETPKEIAEMTKEVDGAIGKTEELNSKIESSKSAFEDQITSIEANKKAQKEMADQLDILIGKESKSATDKQMIKGYVDELNSSMEGLNLTYDEETNKLNLSTDAIHKKIDAYTSFAKAEVAQERQIEIIKELAEAEIQLESNSRQLEKAQADLDEAGFNLFGRNSELIESTEALEAENTNLQNSIVGLQTEYEVVSGIVEQTMEDMAKATEDSTGRQTIAFEQLSEEQQNVVGELQDYYTGLKDHTQDMFNKINDTILTTNDVGKEVAKTSAEIFAEMQATLEHNQEVAATWADNMVELARRGVDEGLLNQLSRLGPEGAPYVQALVDASDEELASLSETFAQGGDVALDALKKALNLEDFEIEGLDNIIAKTEENLRGQVESSGLSEVGGEIVSEVSEGMTQNQESLTTTAKDVANAAKEGFEENKKEEFKQSGTDMITGAKDGMEQTKPDLTNSAKQTATETLQAFKTESGVASPSTKYFQAAADMVRGAVNGINRNKGTLVNATKSMAQEAVRAFRSQRNAAYNAGAYLGMGFNSGLASQRASIMATASSIASAAASAINQALDIRSPSRKGFYSGSMLGKGLALGIEDEFAYVESVAMGLAQRAIPKMEPIDINTALNVPYFRTLNNSPVTTAGRASSSENITDLLRSMNDREVNIVLEDGTIVGKLGPKYNDYFGEIVKGDQRWGGYRQR